MGVPNEPDAAGATSTKAERPTVRKCSTEETMKLDAIEDDEVRQILKIRPRRKLPKRD